MALAFNRTIESPGVEIREVDLSLYAQNLIGTNVMALGFAPQGPIDELINVTSISEFETIYGKPKNPAERYFYHTAKQILQKNGNLVATRLPYGEKDGEGYGSQYSVLAYPISPSAIDATELSAVSSFNLGEPKQLTIDEKDYSKLVNGQLTWVTSLSDLASSNDTFNSFDSLSAAGMIVMNKIRSTTNELMEGSYVVLGDNSTIGYGTDYDTVHGFKTTQSNSSACDWTSIEKGMFNFDLTGSYRMSSGSTSEMVESIPSWDLTPRKYNDTIVLGVIKLRKSIYNNNGIQQIVLDQVLTESYIGSLDMHRKEVPVRGALPESFFIEDIVNKSSNNIQVKVNPLISNGGNWNDITIDDPDNPGETIKTTRAVRIYNEARNGYAIGPYVPMYSALKPKVIGNLWAKIERALRLAENIDYVPLDILVEGGLGTIGVFNAVADEIKNTTAGSSSSFYHLYKNWNGEYYDSIYLPGIIEEDVVGSGEYTENSYRYVEDSPDPHANDTNGITTPLMKAEYGPNETGGRNSYIANEYQAVFEIFRQFVEFTRRPGTLFIADPVRQIFVQGNKLVSECRIWDEDDAKMVDSNFPQHIYWPLKNLYYEVSTSYACTYANWVKATDAESGEFVWLPFSGFAAGIMCDTDRNFFPWFAPAGLNRGRISGIVQIGFNTTQKQRDLLYRSCLNPVVFFPQDGFVVWGQKTLLKTPSAFDRINVRRLFLLLEKATVAVSRYFVFEQNTIFTRTRLVDTITPIFERAKNNEGLYDYMIVCDERNNTPDTIDNNELIVDIYLKPVKTAEFILISFIATRTGQDFSELV